MLLRTGRGGRVQLFVGQGEPGGAFVMNVALSLRERMAWSARAFAGSWRTLLGACLLTTPRGDQARVADGGDAAGVGVVDVAGPGAGGGAGEFTPTSFRSLSTRIFYFAKEKSFPTDCHHFESRFTSTTCVDPLSSRNSDLPW